MRNYEVMYILRPELEDSAITEMVEKFQNQVTEQGGTVEKVDNWGKRAFAYELEGKREGTYVVMTFQAGSEVAEELRRVMKLNEDVLRCLVLNRD